MRFQFTENMMQTIGANNTANAGSKMLRFFYVQGPKCCKYHLKTILAPNAANSVRMRDFRFKMEQITYFSSKRANNKEKCAKLKNKTKKQLRPKKNKFLALVFGTRSPEHLFSSNFLHRTVFTM